VEPRRDSPTLHDAVAIAAAVILSVIWYTTRLGFYSDDWAFLGMYATAPDQSFAGLYDAAHSSQTAMRPGQLVLFTALYRVFGLDPVGYHLTSAGLLVCNAILVYAVLRIFSAPRLIAVSVAVIYAVLPNYSTVRYWYAAFMITLSMAACLGSIYAEMKVVAARPRTGALWKTLALLALIVSVLSYEVAMPLLLAAPVLIAWRVWRHGRTASWRRKVSVTSLLALNVVLLAGLTAFKVRTTDRLGADHGVVAQIGYIGRRAVRFDLESGAYGLNAVNAVRTHFIEYGVKLPAATIRVARTAPPGVLVLAAFFAFSVFFYVNHVLRAEQWPALRHWTALMLAGIAVFGLGYAIFLTNDNVQFTTAGIANRTAIAAALGVAMCMAGGLGIVTAALHGRARLRAYAALVAVVAGSGFLIVNEIGRHWIDAYMAERATLAGIRARFPILPSGSTLVLDGVCPYSGPAIVFESHWDLAGALRVMYGDRTLTANVVSPRMRVERDALVFMLYGRPTRYPYSPRLHVYDARSGDVRTLPEAAAANAYFSRALAAWPCVPGREGIGVEIFSP
jgi:hypothetical protein